MTLENTMKGARTYWSRFFGIDPGDIDRNDILVVPHAALGDWSGAWVWWQDSCTVVSVQQEMVNDLKRRISKSEVDRLRSVSTVSTFFDDRVGKIIGPACHGWIEYKLFDYKKPGAVTSISYKKILELSDLRDRDPDGWRDAGFGEKSDCAFCVVVDQQIVSLAAYTIDDLGAAFIRVFTHPEFRRQGLARAAMGACINDALSKDIPCVYQTLMSNSGAMRAARDVGFIEYGRHLAVRLL